MRHYEPIWLAIKKDFKASLKADPKLHARIKKAVMKEKNKDEGFRLLASEQGKGYNLKILITGNIISFSLKEKKIKNYKIGIHL